MSQPTITPAEFAKKWHGVETNEKASSQSHFIDLCRMLGEITPHEADPIGSFYAFEKRVVKAGGGDGYADVWKRDFFAWEYKGTTIASLAAPMDLGEAMIRYYRGAREIIWSFGGTVDKFMGDGILAVFDFPETEAASTLRATLCAAALIGFGRQVVDDLVAEISVNAPVSGTRVALANGDAFVADSGAEVPEVQFLSQAINIVARIQHSAPLDGIALERRAFARLSAQEPALAAALHAVETTLTAEEVKGQPGPVTIWIVEADAVKHVLSG